MSQTSSRAHWINSGLAWVDAPVLGYPLVWEIHLPTADNHYESIPVESLDEAVQRAAALQTPLDVADHTYEFMVEEGFAPAHRPASIASGGSDLAAPPWIDDLISTYRKAEGILGMPESVACALAHKRQLTIRALHPGDQAIENFVPTRVSFYIEGGIVTKIDVG